MYTVQCSVSIHRKQTYSRYYCEHASNAVMHAGKRGGGGMVTASVSSPRPAPARSVAGGGARAAARHRLSILTNDFH